jgi:hypothetical protein
MGSLKVKPYSMLQVVEILKKAFILIAGLQ